MVKYQKVSKYFVHDCNWINEVIRSNKFPDYLKLSDITPVYKNHDPSDKANLEQSVFYHYYRKYLLKFIYDQLYEYMENFLFIVWFLKSTFQTTCPLQATSEMARKAWLALWVMLVQFSWKSIWLFITWWLYLKELW